MLTPSHFWNDLLVAYLHDPPDKSLDIKGHEARGRRYAEKAIKRNVGSESNTGAAKWADIRASEIERLPLPNAGQNYHRAVGLDDNTLGVTHPLWTSKEAGESRRKLFCQPVNEKELLESIQECSSEIEDPQALFMAMWRLLPDKLAQKSNFYQHLPAETRVPDHTIWQHLDTTAGLFASYEGNDQLALLSLTIGPVQSFIASARSVRDLWSGSMILSKLAFSGMLPIIENLGPTALVFPQLRGNPLMDAWLCSEFPELKDLITLPKVASRKSPCLPNRFVAIVPAAKAAEFEHLCKESVRSAWSKIAGNVQSLLGRDFNAIHSEWDLLWQDQVEHYFDIHTQVLPWQAYQDESLAQVYGHDDFAKVYPESGKLREIDHRLPQVDRPGYTQDSVGRWQARIELLGRLLETRKLLRDHPQYMPRGLTAAKCSLLGTYEQMGPAKLSDSATFWKKAFEQSRGWTRLRKGERLSAIALIKRYAPEAFFCDDLKLTKHDLSIPDTATIAAKHWLEKAKINPQNIRDKYKDWSGQWLHQQLEFDDEEIPSDVKDMIRQARQKNGLPPAYYAILMIDGDDMGLWLQGSKSPPVKQAYHPKIVEYFRQNKLEDILDTPRPVTPAFHAAISEALANFALHIVPDIVDKHQGTLIYAGGDDVLALLPTQTVLACAHELNLAFQGDESVNQGAPRGYYRVGHRDYLMMGPSATLSAGLAIVHHKEDLRQAMNLARNAEKRAKKSGRNALALTASRRSGETADITCLWDELTWMQEWVRLFQEGLSNHWAYQLRETLPVMQTWPVLMMQSEIKRQVNRMEEKDNLRNWFSQQSQEHIDSTAGEHMAKWFENFLERRQSRLDQRADKSPQDFAGFGANCLTEFILTCQTLSFLARGRED